MKTLVHDEETLREILKRHGVRSDSSEAVYKQLESIELVELIMDLEKEYQIEITAFDYKPEHFVDASTIMKLIRQLTLKK